MLFGAAPLAAQTGNPANDSAADALSRNLRSLAENPKSLHALMGAGRAALELGDPQAAITFFARAEEQAPRDGRIKMWIGSALVQLQQPKSALRFFGEAAGLGVPEAELAGERGLAWDISGDQRRAQQDYRLSLRSAANADVRRRLALSLAISGDREGALRELEDMLLVRDPAAERCRALILALSGDTAAASGVVRATMPGGQASVMNAFLSRLTSLTPAERAMAVHLGHFPGEGRTSAPPPQTYASAAPVQIPAATQPARTAPVQPAPAAAQNAKSTPPAAARAKPAQRSAAERPAWSRRTGGFTREIAAAPEEKKAARPAAPAQQPKPVPAQPQQQAPVTQTVRVADAAPAQQQVARPPVQQQPASEILATPGFDLAQPVQQRPAAPLVQVAQADPAPVERAAAAPPVQPVPAQPSRTLSSDPLLAANRAQAQPAAPEPAPVRIAAADPEIAALSEVVASLGASETPPPAPAKAEPKKPAPAKPEAKKAAPAKAEAKKPAPAKKAASAKPDPAKAEPARHWVQIAGGANKGALPREFDRLKGKAPKLFSARAAWTTPLKATNRLLVGPFKTEKEAQAFVNSLSEAGLSGFAWTSDAGQKIEKLSAR